MFPKPNSPTELRHLPTAPPKSSSTHNGVLEALSLVLLLELLDLLQGEEGSAAAAHWLLWVRLAPLIKRLRVPALHVQPQILPVLGHEVAHVA